MRAFHFSWLSFLTAFTGWFAIAPLMPSIRKDLKLTPDQIADSNISSVSSTIIFRVLVGPLCDRIGPRRVMSVLLMVGAIPVGLSGLVQSAEGLIAVRFFVGILGATFVPCQFWTTQMFNSNVVGSANALVGGWGNMGAGITYVLMPLIFDAFFVTAGISESLSWRVTLIFPALLCFVIGLCDFLFTVDCPQGDWLHPTTETASEVHKATSDKKDDIRSIDETEKQAHHQAPPRPGMKQFLLALKDPNVIILMFMYACSFGVELAVDNVLAVFFHDHFNISQKSAGLIGSLFGLMNLFSRATGGFISDYANEKMGIRGRMLVQFIVLLLEGLFLLIFRFSLHNLGEAIVILIIFSYFTQACCGTSFGIVPFVDPAIVGAISGLIGAGGNIGGVAFNAVFKLYSGGDTPIGFMVLGIVVMVVSFSTFLLKIDGRRLIEFKKSYS
ncbi:14538_t:CDS:2 [Funneliformis geosporum]|uniref:Nitrate/nitrite transporter n=1 Tax=Funneliformis geosporum TaxID=1117311 RepID=A0A9W4SBK1_9GLOM|nr:12692_t:CDS:2 [Funneliformis geosporum]CAI2165117.1 14538_t:CDS:2 [Funneliformis geosporum]